VGRSVKHAPRLNLSAMECDRPHRQLELYEPGTTVAGRYSVRRHVANGGRAIVYLADDLLYTKTIALKVARPDKSNASADIEHEARHLTRIGGRLVPRVYDVGYLDSGQAYVALEWIDGEPLEKIRERCTISLVDILDVACALADALVEIHSHNVIHRDIKPSNVIVPIESQPDFSRARMVDFGLAREVRHANDCNAPVAFGRQAGTLAYMATEQLAGRGQTALTDVFGLGATLFFMLYGRAPLEPDDLVRAHATFTNGEKTQALFTGPFLLRRLTQDIELPEEPFYPAAVRELVSVMLRRSPAERVQSATEVRTRLQLVASSCAHIRGSITRT
jgi:serine/threonine protein kinase